MEGAPWRAIPGTGCCFAPPPRLLLPSTFTCFGICLSRLNKAPPPGTFLPNSPSGPLLPLWRGTKGCLVRPPQLLLQLPRGWRGEQLPGARFPPSGGPNQGLGSDARDPVSVALPWLSGIPATALQCLGRETRGALSGHQAAPLELLSFHTLCLQAWEPSLLVQTAGQGSVWGAHGAEAGALCTHHPLGWSREARGLSQSLCWRGRTLPGVSHQQHGPGYK